MKTLRYLGLLVCVLTILAFVSGCGGGGGGGTDMSGGSDPMMPDPTPPAQPTDAERIAQAQQEVATILSNAQARAGAASSAASALQDNQDATADQMARARNHDTAARNALARIVSANSAARAATTPAAAQTALDNARTAQNTLNIEASAISSIETAVRTMTNARTQREMDETAQTGGSSLIKHLRDNKKVSDAVLASLRGATPANFIVVGATTDAPTPGTNTGSATYPFHKGDSSASPAIPTTQYPKPRNIDRGVLGVRVSVGGTNVPSTSQTDKISGSGRLPNGFDLKDDDGRFATVYTDITVAKQVRSKNAAGDNAEPDDTSTEGIDERYTYVADTDYLLAGLWLDDSATDGSDPVLTAFAFGNQPLAATYNFCTAADVTNTDTLTRNCGDTSGTSTIAGFVDENESEKATYTGGVNGAYFAGGRASHFKANVSLEANFVRGSADDVNGSKISGEITSIVAGGNPITGSIDLKEQSLANDISTAFANGEAAGVIAGHAYTGAWKGQFFGMRASTPTRETTGTVATNDRTTTTTYTPDKPGSVAGSFYVNRETVGEGDASFIGAFGAHR